MGLPHIKLDHLKTLTDDTGILQHAKYSTPRRSEGYTTDDNARALIVCVKHHQLFGNHEIKRLIEIYLSFLLHMQRSDGKFHNLLSYDRHFRDEVGSEDCMGRALWACGSVINSNLPKDKQYLAKELFDRGIKWVRTFTSPRAKAYTILGLQHYQGAFPTDTNLRLNIKTLTDQLCTLYHHTATPDWQWFEPYLTYANARLPHSLFEAYTTTTDRTYLHIAESTFGFLIQNQISKDKLHPVSNQWRYMNHDEQAVYDQQPLEAACIVAAATTAFHVTRTEQYRRTAHIAFQWFLGRNVQHLSVYNPNTGGCYDGITPQGINLNQGAESTICYLLARLELENTKLTKTLKI